jgi:hypothetical protein
MNPLAYFRSLTAKFFHRSQTEDEMEEELRAHIEHLVDDLESSGLDRVEAERRACGGPARPSVERHFFPRRSRRYPLSVTDGSGESAKHQEKTLKEVWQPDE